jgi:hypothetical protein
MKRSVKYIIEEQRKELNSIKNQILIYASKHNKAFDFPSGKIKTKMGDKRNLLDRFMVDFRLQGTPKIRLMWLLSTAMKELIEEGKMFKRRNTREYKRQRGSVLYFTTMFAYADSEDKLKTISEKLGELANSYHEEKFVSDIICPNPESLVGKEVIISKGGVHENYTYTCSVKSDNIIDVNQEVEEMKNINEVKSDYYYISYLSLMSLIEILNMKGFRDFQIRTKIDCYKYEMNDPEKRKYLKELDNNVSVGDEIYTMDFMVKILG